MAWEPKWERVEVGGNLDVEVAKTRGGNLWLRIDAWDRSTARVVAEGFGRIIESDVTDDGRWSFAVVPYRVPGQEEFTQS